MSSKTGLLPSNKTESSICPFNPVTTLNLPNVASPAPYTLRPFASLYNPYPYGCSVLCNHPADYEAKDVVKKAKDAWALEGKVSSIDKQKGTSISEGIVPEELFRRYTETDSRPVTPAPTIASIVTKSSIRRCLTPEPITIPGREKMLLVLDLRRSHSQDTLSWQGTDVIPITVLQPPTPKLTRTPGSTESSNKRKKPIRSKTIDIKDSNQTEPTSLKESNFTQTLKSPVTDDSLTDRSDGTIVKRRGKKIKGKKMKKTGRGGEKEFQGILEPGETQVSTLGDDSRATSNRPSLTPLTPDLKETEQPKLTIEKPVSFIDEESLKLFQRQLDQETVEIEFDFKRKIALSEALKMCPFKTRQQGEELKNLKEEFQKVLNTNRTEKWLHVPRVFSRRSAKFELPLDSKILNNITALQYAQNYVFPSKERLVLYNQIFNLHKEEFDEDEQQYERILSGKNIITCLGEVMGRPLNETEEKQIQNLFGWQIRGCYDFRTMAGISAICERLFGPNFVPTWPTHEQDPRHEIEVADFQTLDRKLLYLKPKPELLIILKKIENT